MHAYIIDTGIRATHQEFAGRIGNGFTAVNDGNGTNDCNGHGTHVAGTVGGTTYGVAKAVTLHAVRVLELPGLGLELGRHRRRRLGDAEPRQARGGEHEPRRRRVAALDTAVANSIAAGVTYAVAAGNDERQRVQLLAGPRRRRR